VAWSEIRGSEPPKDKRGANGVRVVTADGFIFLRLGGAHGENGKFKDVFSFVSLLNALRAQP